MKQRPCRLLTFTVFALMLSAAMPTYAAKIYMWYTTDESGKKVPNYGETPPRGVEAKLISGSETSAPTPAAATETAPAADQPLTEEQKKMRAQREADCDAEEQRLAMLKTSGSRIRMANPDGTSRYLTPDEVVKEIEMSETFLKDACGR